MFVVFIKSLLACRILVTLRPSDIEVRNTAKEDTVFLEKKKKRTADDQNDW